MSGGPKLLLLDRLALDFASMSTMAVPSLVAKRDLRAT